MPRKYFTVEEADALLPALTELLQKMLAARQHIIDTRKTWEPIIEKAGSNGGGAHGKQLYRDTDRIHLTLEQLTDWGILIKDVDTGLVDLPHLRDGREVFLCWRLGESQVSYWHEVDAGFTGRKPL